MSTPPKSEDQSTSEQTVQETETTEPGDPVVVEQPDHGSESEMPSHSSNKQKGKGKEKDDHRPGSGDLSKVRSHEHTSECDDDCGGALGEVWHKKSGKGDKPYGHAGGKRKSKD